MCAQHRLLHPRPQGLPAYAKTFQTAGSTEFSAGISARDSTIGTADRAYVVAPADFRFKENGKDGSDLGALFTVALQKGQAGWRITGWAWSRP
jgi:hypothetical protein